LDCRPVSVEITYGLERLAMYLQGVDSVYSLLWNQHPATGPIDYGQVYHQNEVEHSHYNFELSDPELLLTLFNQFEAEALRLLHHCQAQLDSETADPTREIILLPAYDYVLKCSHTFNLLDARGVIAVAERTRYIGRIRTLARQIAQLYVQQRAAQGYPLLREHPLAA